MPRWPGGLIRKTPVTPAGPYQNGAAPGVWTLAEVAYWTKQGLWPTAGVTSWIGILSSASTEYGTACATDTAGNFYVAGYENGYAGVIKYNSAGVLQWQRRIGSAEVPRGVAVDSSGNVYLGGETLAPGYYQIMVAKYDASGALQWQRTFGDPTLSYTAKYGYVALDASGNIYLAGTTNNAGDAAILVVKYNSSGTLQWQRRLLGPSYSYAQGIAVDTSGNVFVAGQASDGGLCMRLVKYNSSGTLQWQRKLQSGGYAAGGGVSTDASGNAYVCANVNGTNNFCVYKYDGSGNVQWQRSIGNSGSMYGVSASVDASGNVYACGQSDASGTTDFQIVKYDTSGTLLWQRRLETSGSDVPFQICASGSDFFITGYTTVNGGNYDMLFAKLPGDGSKTGTYSVGGVSVTYASTALATATVSYTSSTTTATDANPGLSSSVGTMTSSTTSLTSSVTTL